MCLKTSYPTANPTPTNHRQATGQKGNNMEILSAEIRSQITTAEMEQFAAEASRSIVIRYSINGNSDDRRRDTTPEEADIINFGALCNIRHGRDIQSTADAAEFIGMEFLPGAGSSYDQPHANSYDTIYLPIKRFARLQQQRATA